jgi:hypothetical protein
MAAKDYAVLVLSSLALIAMTVWVIVDKSTDLSRTLVFPPTLSVIMVAGAAIGFVTFFTLAIIYVLKA